MLPYSNAPLYYPNMPRGRHPKKEIEAALRDAEARGWAVAIAATAHRWGVMTCPEESRAGCRSSIWSTPRNAGNHARQIRQALNRCPHAGREE